MAPILFILANSAGLPQINPSCPIFKKGWNYASVIQVCNSSILLELDRDLLWCFIMGLERDPTLHKSKITFYLKIGIEFYIFSELISRYLLESNLSKNIRMAGQS
jgi:hypothetical protein